MLRLYYFEMNAVGMPTYVGYLWISSQIHHYYFPLLACPSSANLIHYWYWTHWSFRIHFAALLFLQGWIWLNTDILPFRPWRTWHKTHQSAWYESLSTLKVDYFLFDVSEFSDREYIALDDFLPRGKIEIEDGLGLLIDERNDIES
jgi:hypothetical protein